MVCKSLGERFEYICPALYDAHVLTLVYSTHTHIFMYISVDISSPREREREKKEEKE